MKVWSYLAGVAAALTVGACGHAGTAGAGGAGGATGSGTTHVASSSHATGAGGTGGAPGPCGSLVWDPMNAACNQCMVDSCCDKLMACDTGTACGGLLACADGCASGDSVCFKACQKSHATGQMDLDAVFTCFDASCKDTAACGAKVCDSMVSVSDMGCGDCLSTSCCDSWKACSADATCLACLTTSPLPAGCSGNGLYTAAQTCESTSCAMACDSTICDSGLGTTSPPCNYCLGQSCCAPLEDCAADASCKGCLTSGGKDAGCATDALYTTYTSCDTTHCAMACGG